jgi:hypothetical protein
MPYRNQKQQLAILTSQRTPYDAKTHALNGEPLADLLSSRGAAMKINAAFSRDLFAWGEKTQNNSNNTIKSDRLSSPAARRLFAKPVLVFFAFTRTLVRLGSCNGNLTFQSTLGTTTIVLAFLMNAI